MNQNNPPPSNKGPLALLIGTVAAAGLYMTIPEDEGTRFTAYQDIVGVWTICQGDTKNVHPGMVETREGCQKRLESQLLAHAKPVMACTPRLAENGRDYQRWAAVSLAYNVGVGAYCRSSIDRAFDAGQWRSGCDAIMKYRFAGGREIRGLKLRRERERAICLRGL
jgi:lysozyme